MSMSSGTILVTDGHFNDALRRLKKYFSENIQRELRMRQGFVNRKKEKKAIALKRLRKREKERRNFDG